MENQESHVLGVIKVNKASGEVVPFDEAKLVHSLERSGADDDAIAEVLKEVRHNLVEGITTKKIYKMAFPILRKKTEASAARYQLSNEERLLLRKRSVIETVNDQLKDICHAEHTRHRSISGFLLNLMGALAAYSFFEKKPSITPIVKERKPAEIYANESQLLLAA